MRKLKYINLLFFFNILNSQNNNSIIDLTLIGTVNFNDGLGRIPIGIADNLNQYIKINLINTNTLSNEDPILKKVLTQVQNKDNLFGKVILVTELSTTKKAIENLPNNDNIKILYSMFETTKIPSLWLPYINNYFDLVIVPDEFWVEIYKNSGVKIPIFVLPIGLYLDSFLKKKIKTKSHNPFVFGCLNSFDDRKNYELLIQSFIQEFGGSNKDVVLKINGRSFDNNRLKIILQKLNAENVILTNYELPWDDYINFISQLDCYVNLSKGEGFSISPREAMALGIPCVLSNNTAQKTICNSSFVEFVKSEILEKPIFYESVFNDDLGFFYNSDICDVKKALRKIYNNYNKYLFNSNYSRNWANQYNWSNLKTKYLNLIKPKTVKYGVTNMITDDYLMTNSISLYEKYKKIIIEGYG